LALFLHLKTNYKLHTLIKLKAKSDPVMLFSVGKGLVKLCMQFMNHNNENGRRCEGCFPYKVVLAALCVLTNFSEQTEDSNYLVLLDVGGSWK
jgi:hypothetical protein